MDIVSIYKHFPSQNDCIEYLEQVRWNHNPQCPCCKSHNQTPMPNEHRYHCNNCNTSYSVTVGTIFHKTKLDLQKWFLAITLILNAKKGVSARQLSRDLEVNKNTAWYMGMRIRHAMIEEKELLNGFVEIDETYIGGKPRKGDGKEHKRGRGTDKTPVVGMAERGGKVFAKVHKKLDSKNLAHLVREHVNIRNATIVTDEYSGYVRLKLFSNHMVINHQKSYAEGEIHTNTIEGFWALLKRGIVGQYHKVSVRYLNRYICEFCYRYNNRKIEDLFGVTIQKAVGII